MGKKLCVALSCLMTAAIILLPGCDTPGFSPIFVAVAGDSLSSAGLIACSEDGMNWPNAEFQNFGHVFTEAAYYYDRYIVVGEFGHIYYSTDGQTWAYRTSAPCALLMGVAGGDSDTAPSPWTAHYVAVGEYGTVLVSTDGGANWSGDTNSRTSRHLYSVVGGPVTVQGFQSHRFVAIGECVQNPSSGVWDAVIIWSNDGGWNWLHKSTGGSVYSLWGVGYGNQRFVAVGHNSTIIYSDNGAAWYPATVSGSGTLLAATWANGIWVAVGSYGTVFYSMDGGLNWTAGNLTGSTLSYTDVVYGNGRFVALGYDANQNGGVITSTDGINWTIGDTFLNTGLSAGGLAVEH